MSTGRLYRSDDGHIVLELLMLVTLLAALVDVVVYSNRVPRVRAQVDKAAKSAAQEASVHRSPAVARASALEIASENLSLNGVHCDDVEVHVDTSDWRPGGLVRTDVSCLIETSDLQWLPFPGRRLVESSFLAPIDTHKVLDAAT